MSREQLDRVGRQEKLHRVGSNAIQKRLDKISLPLDIQGDFRLINDHDACSILRAYRIAEKEEELPLAGRERVGI